MQQPEVVVDHTHCQELMNRSMRVSRHPNPSAVAAQALSTSNVHYNIVDRGTLCLFNPRSSSCQQTSNRGSLSQQLEVRQYAANRQTSTFRSVENAIDNNRRRNDNKRNAVCSKLAEQVKG